MNIKNVFKYILFIVLIILLGVSMLYAYKDYQISQDQKRLDMLYTRILEGSSDSPTSSSVDFDSNSILGSSLIYGGSHSPPVSQQNAWDEISRVGVTSIRKDFYIERILPNNITLDDYKKNKGNIQDPQNWNQDKIREIINIMDNAKRRNMKIIGIHSFSPAWLTYSGTTTGMPKDWQVYRDITEKIYTIFRPYLDYLEIWNEPDLPEDKYYLDTTNTNLTKKEAYQKIYENASIAIKNVDRKINDGKDIPLGGPVAAKKENIDYIENFLQDSVSKIDFVSYHQYESKPTKSNLWFEESLKKNNKTNLPIFITEWNYSSKGQEVKDTVLSDEGIIYTGNMFINYLKMGIKGANYHTLTSLDENKPDGIAKYHAFYKITNGNVELLPLTRTWMLFSNKMGLGSGESKIYTINMQDKTLNGFGFKNSKKEYGFVIINGEDESKFTSVKLSNINDGHFAQMSMFVASSQNNSQNPIYSGEIRKKEKVIDMTVYLPKKSIIGVILKDDDNLYNIIKR